MPQIIDTLITFSIIAVFMLSGVVASEIYEHYNERKAK